VGYHGVLEWSIYSWFAACKPIVLGANRIHVLAVRSSILRFLRIPFSYPFRYVTVGYIRHTFYLLHQWFLNSLKTIPQSGTRHRPAYNFSLISVIQILRLPAFPCSFGAGHHVSIPSAQPGLALFLLCESEAAACTPRTSKFGGRGR
jgi:hypothetical protein